ncbi:RNA polymerase sigma factor [Limnoglobus roseus]|uniref:RNA polymerase sigma factor n=1 Tax=Limnoglobus roseus TaxID=2598579 RepID=A0A5C1AGI7_9BACT|nr:sigma-70 family RNA polymerase sigma factor [Limnoglobus roseus]QEL17096.1 RNA polymerase sigma factor [Limnoglobus roseus]
MTTDRDWVVAAVRQYERPLLAYVRRLLPDGERGRDVVQDAFLQLCQQPRAELESRLAPWLFAVCRRRAIDILRKDHRMIATLDPVAEPPARGPEPTQTAETNDTTRVVLGHLAALPTDQNEAVRLRFQNHFSYREIAEVMGLSESHVGVLLHQAMKALRTKLPHLA